MILQTLIFFGRRGVGVSSVAAHLGAAWAESGHKVMVVGCAGGSATSLLHRSNPLPIDHMATGFKGISCLEWSEDNLIERLPDALVGLSDLTPVPELVLFDVADNLRILDALLNVGYGDRVVAISDAEPGSLQAVNRLWAHLGGREVEVDLIANNLPASYADNIVADFARKTGVMLTSLPRSLAVTRSAFFGETVIEAAPLAHASYLYREVAGLLRGPSESPPPVPLNDEEFCEWSADWGERLFNLGEGYVGFGGGI